MRTYLMTRGTARDYDYSFIGATPPDRWWSTLDGLIILEEPEVAAARRGAHVAVLISGIPSSRRDVIGTAIRYTVVVEVDDQDTGLLGRLVAAGLDPAGRRQLGEALDKELDADLIDAVYAGRSDGASVPELTAEVLRAFPYEVVPPGRDHPFRSWAGSLDRPEHRAYLVGRVASLARDGRGYAFTSHALSTANGAEEGRLQAGTDIAILSADGTFDEVVELGKERPPAPTTAGTSGPRTLILVAVAVAVAGVAVLAWWIWRRLS